MLKNVLKVLPLGVVLPVVIGAASVKPNDAMSNLSEWAHWLGIHHVPDWLVSPSADKNVIMAYVLFALVYIGFMWRSDILKIFQKKVDLPSPRQEEEISQPERIFVDTTPAKLMKLYDGRTSFAADALARPYLGKWMQISGKLDNIKSIDPVMNKKSILVSISLLSTPDSRYIYLLFDEEWLDRLSILEKNKKIQAIGKISRINPRDIECTECELVKD